MKSALAAALLVVGISACLQSLEPLPFTMELEASAVTTVPGDSLTFTVSAQGGSLTGVDIDFGDGNGDLFATAGARTARVVFRHAFVAAGTYPVRASATDAIEGQKDAMLEIRVN
jgi:hypothetical protein